MTESGIIRSGARAVPVALWMGIMAALVIEAAALIARTALGDFTSFAPYLADLGRIATRATIVSGAIALAMLAPRPLVPFVAATFGAAFGPLACIAGRAVASGFRARLGLPAVATDPSVLALLGLVRSAEFASLGLLAGLLASRRAPVASFGWAGVAVASVFGVAIVAVRHEVVLGALSTGDIIAYAIEELVFPVAIALILAAASHVIEIRDVRTRAAVAPVLVRR